jgi:hypothetical protein
VALAVVLAVGLVGVGRLADWPAPAPPAAPGDEALWPAPIPLRLTGVVGVGRGRLPHGGTWRLEAGRYDRPNSDGKREIVGYLVLAWRGHDETSAMRTFEEPVQLGVDTSLTEYTPIRVRLVFGAVSQRAARVVVIPRQGPAVRSPIRAELLDRRTGLSVRFWIAFLPAGGTPAQTVHQVRSYDANGRELCRLDADSIAPRCTG